MEIVIIVRVGGRRGVLVDASYRSEKKNDRRSVRTSNFNFLSCSI